MSRWVARCPKRDEGCDWTIVGFTEDAAREAGRQHYRDTHKPKWQAKCSRKDCDWQVKTITEQDARAAWRKHIDETHPVVYPTYPYRGKPNKTQLRLLALAADERLEAYLCRVHDLSKAPAVVASSIDLSDLMTGGSTPWSSWQWYPTLAKARGLNRGHLNWVQGLLEAGLLRHPKFPPDSRGLVHGMYRITPEGRRVLARHAMKESVNV